ncbi:MAG TPA: type III-B CRISPR-associated protein Cas10/Cmr2 [Bacillota bacterium]|nr:type III-B CRISPR-associated protein Cas10/Cmr2 [Bacillota bacterium]HOQ03401.1 type III-B CRISPR-associated protein Cas10/Cmr2 [Bacillota bacterium]HPV13802.1 type III-B CRISPR-associated protein Cas10/Cmr2 [Bacillota bacterium]HQD74721.1 type III-B CRISPR-associated protein Cas10/Cmr2 [Bacillota bacterium]
MDEVHLVLYHIGPVQDFIRSSRRSRDLWFGSWLLSELSKTAALEIVEQNGGDLAWSLISPAPETLSQLKSDEFNVANRIIARTRKDPAVLGEAVRARVISRLHEISDEAFSRIESVAEFDRKTADLQVDDLLEFFWVSCPLGDNYARTRFQAESLMAARKVTRDFNASTWGSSQNKSSLDGLRESVIPKKAYSKRNKDQNRLKRELRTKYGVREGEYLCGVGMLKRHGKRGEQEHFYSTSHMAAMPLLDRLNESHRQAVNDYISRLKELGIGSDALNTVPVPHEIFGRNDGQLLFSERLADYFDGDDLEQAQKALDKFLEEVFKEDRPIPYYVLLQADGDNMGMIINEQETIDEHRELSRRLSTFAQKADPIVTEYHGCLIYAGGEDVLALLPMHTAIECAKKLADTFAQDMADFTVLDPQTNKDIRPSLSAGLAIVHHLEPLSNSLEAVRQAEKYAKSIKGKNALAITLTKRGGSERTIGGTWGTLDQRLEYFIDLFLKEDISTQAAYELETLAMTLEGSGDDNYYLPHEAISAEVRRILGRKKASRGTREVSENVVNSLSDLVESKKISVEQLADELIVARELASAYRLAGKEEKR